MSVKKANCLLAIKIKRFRAFGQSKVRILFVFLVGQFSRGPFLESPLIREIITDNFGGRQPGVYSL